MYVHVTEAIQQVNRTLSAVTWYYTLTQTTSGHNLDTIEHLRVISRTNQLN